MINEMNEVDQELVQLLATARNRIWDLTNDADGQSFKEGQKFLYWVDKKLAEVRGEPAPNRDHY